MLKFEYNGKKYPLSLNLFNKHSLFYTTNELKAQRNEVFDLSDMNYFLDHSEETIIKFIQYFESQTIELTDINVITINYLSDKYQVPKLIELTENYINDHYKGIIDHFYSKIGPYHQFRAEKYEEIISKHFLNCALELRFTKLPISTIYRVVSLYYQNEYEPALDEFKKELRDGTITSFLINCFDEKGIETTVIIPKMKLNYSNIFSICKIIEDKDEIYKEMIQTIISQSPNIFCELVNEHQNLRKQVFQIYNEINEEILHNKNKLSFVIENLQLKKLMKLDVNQTEIFEGQFCDLNIQEFKIPPSVKNIRNKAFYGCNSLKQIAFPPSVTSIYSDAFNKCTSLKQISLHPSSNIVFEYRTFEGIKSIEVIGNIKKIPANIFAYCSALQNVSIPSSVTIIGKTLFVDVLL